MEERCGGEPRALPDDLAVLPPAARAAVLEGLAVVAPDGVLDEAVALDPAALLAAPELPPDLRREPVEQVEERGGIPSHQGAAEGERLAAGVGEDAGGDALGGAPSLVFMRLVADEQVEKAPQVVLHVVGEGVALRPRGVRLPEGGAALVAGALPAPKIPQGQRQPVLVDDRLEAVRAAGHAEGLQRLLVPDEPAVRGRPALDDGRQPAVRELGALPGHDREERPRSVGEAQALEVGDGGDDGGAGVGHRLLDLPLPLAGEVGRAEDEDAAEAGQVGGRSGDEGLSSAHLADDGGAAVLLEGEGRAADSVRLRPQGRAQQGRQGLPAVRGPVAGRVGLHHPLGDGVAVGVDELAEVHGSVPFLM